MFYGPILSLPGNDKVFPKKPAVDGRGGAWRRMESRRSSKEVILAALFSHSAGRTISSELQAQAGRQGSGKGSHGFWRQ